ACGTITSSTTLSSDCAAPLTVGAGGITVDLGGNSVLCPEAPNETGIDVGSRSNVVVKNGSVNGCDTGVIADGGDSNHYEGLTLTNNKLGFLVGNGVLSRFIRNEVVGNSTSAGVFLYHTTGFVVQGNRVSNSAPGIFDNGGTNNVIVSNTA